ncbi:DUF6055 domain-containing protein [Candidatus Sumerlaeota bacterium]
MRRLFVLFVCVAAVASAAAAPEHDYFRNARYPGSLREDVGLDTVEQAPAAGAQPGLRVVRWWPKRGVDIVDVPEGVPLRTWTVRTPEEEPLVEMGFFAKWWDATLVGKRQFKAHLIGFRGVGSELGNPFDAEAFRRAFGTNGKGSCPAVVLRLEDGRKRCFTRGSLSNADQKYVTKLYDKEMDRIRKSLENLPRPTSEHMIKSWPQGEIYKPGTFRVETQHFVVAGGSQTPIGAHSPWVDASLKKETTQYRKATLGVFEDFWAYLEYTGHLMPHWGGSADGFVRYFVTVPGTMRDGFGEIPGFAGGGGGGCGIRHAAWHALFHEWGHGSRTGGWGIGGGETFCDSLQTIGDPTITAKADHQVNRPYKNLFHGAYPGALGYMLISEDPNWGYAFSSSIGSQGVRLENTPMHTIARIGRDRGLWQPGEAIRGMGDLMAQAAARFAEFDCELQAGLRQMFAAPLHQFLYPLDREQGLYRCNMSQAPEPFGVNHILLKPDKGAKKITVDFRGHFDAATYSDWRVCIVGVDDKGRCRYSPLWNKGEMSLETKEGDQRYWLVVTATPTALLPAGPGSARDANLLYEQDYAYKYPYDVKLTGCRPGGPNLPIGAHDNWQLNGPGYYASDAITGGPRGRSYDWPHPSDTPEYAKMKKFLEPIIAACPAYSELLFDPELFDERYGWWHNRILVCALFQDIRAKYLLANAIGSRHPNGGGWVAKGSKVAPSAYLGPDCMALDGAQVLDNAILEDNAIVSGKDVVIKDNARLFGGAVVCGAAEVSGFARVSRNISNRQPHLTYNREGHPDAPEYDVRIYPDMPIERTHPERRSLWYLATYVGLEANYGMDREETVLLEDLFQERGHPLQELLCYDGVMYGKPGFAVDGQHRGYTFNGKNQYAELAPMVADFGTITVDVALKLAGSGERTIFDFGSSADDCFKLSVGPAGAIALVTLVDGKKESLAASAVAAGKWTTIRVEIDGKTMAIFNDSKKVASRASTFRPADVFPGGCVKRNFIGATREGKNYFQGTLDHVRIYSVINQDFAKDGIVPEISSRRVDPSFLSRFEQFTELNAQRLKAWEQSAAAKKAPSIDTSRLSTWQQQVAEIRQERKGLGKARTDELDKEAKDFKKKYEEFRVELGKKFDARRGVRKKLVQAKELEEQVSVIRQELDEKNTEVAASKELMDDAQRALRAIEDEANKASRERDRAVQERVNELNKQYNELVAAAKAKDPHYQTALEAVEAVRKKLAALPKDTPAEKRQELQSELKERETQRRQEERRVVSAPGLVGPREELQTLREKINNRRRRAVAAAPGRKEAQAKFEAARAALRAAEQRRYDDPRLEALSKQLAPLDTQRERDEFVRLSSLDMFIELKKKEGAVKTHAIRAQMLNNADEHYGIGAWGTGDFSRAIRGHLAQYRQFAITEDDEKLQQALEAQQREWVTEVDWDSRMEFEMGEREDIAPHQLRWLQRVKPHKYK